MYTFFSDRMVRGGGEVEGEGETDGGGEVGGEAGMMSLSCRLTGGE